MHTHHALQALVILHSKHTNKQILYTFSRQVYSENVGDHEIISVVPIVYKSESGMKSCIYSPRKRAGIV